MVEKDVHFRIFSSLKKQTYHIQLEIESGAAFRSLYSHQDFPLWSCGSFCMFSIGKHSH